jgi:hypothetical protein
LGSQLAREGEGGVVTPSEGLTSGEMVGGRWATTRCGGGRRHSGASLLERRRKEEVRASFKGVR